MFRPMWLAVLGFISMLSHAQEARFELQRPMSRVPHSHPRILSAQYQMTETFYDQNGDGTIDRLRMNGAGIRLMNLLTFEGFGLSYQRAQDLDYFALNMDGNYQVWAKPFIATTDSQGRPTLIYQIRMMVRGEGRYNQFQYTGSDGEEVRLNSTFIGVTPEVVASVVGISPSVVSFAAIHVGPTLGGGHAASDSDTAQAVVGGQIMLEGFLRVNFKNGMQFTGVAQELVRLNFFTDQQAALSSTLLLGRFSSPEIRDSHTRFYAGLGGVLDYFTPNSSRSVSQPQWRTTVLLLTGLEFGTPGPGTSRPRD